MSPRWIALVDEEDNYSTSVMNVPGGVLVRTAFWNVPGKHEVEARGVAVCHVPGVMFDEGADELVAISDARAAVARDQGDHRG
jgi:hypothetical protein